jgi:hypothetical protein
MLDGLERTIRAESENKTREIVNQLKDEILTQRMVQCRQLEEQLKSMEKGQLGSECLA